MRGCLLIRAEAKSFANISSERAERSGPTSASVPSRLERPRPVCGSAGLSHSWYLELISPSVEVRLVLSSLNLPKTDQRSREWKGIEPGYYAMPFEDRYIWGIIAGSVSDL